MAVFAVTIAELAATILALVVVRLVNNVPILASSVCIAVAIWPSVSSIAGALANNPILLST